jgi:small conductance mechanosensitive channel
MTFASLFVLLFFLAQDPAPQDAIEGLQASERQVSVEFVTDDASIERRLRQILETTGRFDGVKLEVRHGVALLQGELADDTARVWVIDLVKNTEGVVAVSSGLKLKAVPVWDLRPAYEELSTLWRRFVASLPRLLAGLLVLVVVVLSSNRIARLISRPLAKDTQSELLRTIIGKTIAFCVWMIGLFLFFRVAGLSQLAITIVGGTGVLGIVLGFAFRDIAENFLASVLISVQRPFRYGDTIEVGGYLGVVQRVTPRGTILMDFEGNFIQIANAQVYKSTIKNFTANPNVRQDFTVGIGYDASITRAQEIAMKILEEHSAVLADPRSMVLVHEFAPATINLRVYFWVDGKQHSKVKVRSAVMRMVLRALEAGGVSMPDEAREIIFPHGVPVQMLSASSAASSAEVAVIHAEPQAEVQHVADRHDESTSAEAGLESEVADLNEQARQSRDPEEGSDVMAS